MNRRMSTSQGGPEIGGLMVEVQDRTKESFQRLATAELPALYWLARRLVRDGVEDFSLYQTLVEQDPLPYSDTLHHDYLRAFGNEDVREVLLRLPELYRAPLVLRYMDGFATKEIARLLDAPLGTILARLHRGRKRFEQELWTYAQENGLLLKGTVR